MIRFDGECLDYQGRTVVRDLQFSIAAGERVALVGKSGAGKSTLLKAMRRQLQRGLAWCPQNPGLVPMLSIYHNIFMGGLQHHNTLYNIANLIRPFGKPWHHIENLARELELHEPLHQAVGQLSGGQQQRVAIGRALFGGHAIFLGDEPVSALDDFQSLRVLEVICRRHSTVVLALHDTEQALRVCDRVIGLRDGRLVLDAPSSTIESGQLQKLYR